MRETGAVARHSALRLTPGTDVVPTARRFVIDYLSVLHVDDGVRGDAALVASELVTNALRHGPPPLLLDVAVTAATVRITVSDSSTVEPQLPPTSSEAESGRGLALLDAIAAAWGSDSSATGKRVWCELRRP